MATTKKLIQYLDENKVPYITLTHSLAYTSQGVAQKLHRSGKLIAKAVLLKKNGKFLMAVLEAPDHVNLKELEKVAGEAGLALASEKEFEGLFTDCEVGAIPPFGNLYNLPVYVDQKLEEDEDIIFNAGTHRDAIEMKYVDFKRLVNPTIGNFSQAIE